MKNPRKLTIAEYEFPVVLEKEKDVFVAKCPVWNDCYAQGDSIEDAINEISYVAASLIELYKEEGLKIPLKLKKVSEKSLKSIKLSFPLVISVS